MIFCNLIVHHFQVEFKLISNLYYQEEISYVCLSVLARCGLDSFQSSLLSLCNIRITMCFSILNFIVSSVSRLATSGT